MKLITFNIVLLFVACTQQQPATKTKPQVTLSPAMTTVYCPEKNLQGEIPTELIQGLERSTKRTYTGCELMEIFPTKIDTTYGGQN